MYVQTNTPSEATASDLIHQSDDAYYSPCSNHFLLIIHIHAYESIEPILNHDSHLKSLVVRTLKDLRVYQSSAEHPTGYYSQVTMVESGITALLTDNLRECFDAYCKFKTNNVDIMSKLSILHQSVVNEKCLVDIAVYHRIVDSQDDLIPLMFVEFTKKEIKLKKNQASVYANHLMQLTKDPQRRVPLLGVTMNFNQIDLKVYAMTVVCDEYRIGETNIRSFSFANIEDCYRLLHIMYGWLTECSKFLMMESKQKQKELLTFRKNSNVFILDDKVYKCYDYRSSSKNMSSTSTEERRCSDCYHYGKITMTEVIGWVDPLDTKSQLQIFVYDKLEGEHKPSYVGHFTCLLRELDELHKKKIVHGDIRLSNIIFTKEPVSSRFIDFDLSGFCGEKKYSSRFTVEIDDGYRHAEVAPLATLEYRHDIAAVKWILNQFKVTADEVSTESLNKIGDMKTQTTLSEMIDAISELDQDLEVNIKSERQSHILCEGTGSPQF